MPHKHDVICVLILLIYQHPSPEMRQAAFALVGDFSKSHYDALAPHLGAYCDLVLYV